jgi:hypothetical protein
LPLHVCTPFDVASMSIGGSRLPARLRTGPFTDTAVISDDEASTS